MGLAIAAARHDAELLARLPEVEALIDRALELSSGKRASLFVAYAEAVSIRTQNRAKFRSMLEKAAAIDPDKCEQVRLFNLIAQRRARWLLGRSDELFLEAESAPAHEGERK